MTKAITTKRFVLITKDGSRFFLDEKEANMVKKAIKQGLTYLEIGESLISIYDFARLVTGESYEQTERIKKGEWRCKYGEWHSRGEECAHGFLDQFSNRTN